jgi:hypothetical protein
MNPQFFKRKLRQVLPVFGLTILFFTLFLNNLNAQTMKLNYHLQSRWIYE